MIWTHRGKVIPVEIYHGVPAGWYEAQVIRTHAQLGGTYPMASISATEPGAPSRFPERDCWLQYRKTLYRVADGVKAGDAACVELAIRFIELRYIGSYSGYVRAKFARRLKNATMTPAQKNRLRTHFTNLILSRDFTQEFPTYMKLWARIFDPGELNSLSEALEGSYDGDAMLATLQNILQPIKVSRA